MLTLNELVAGRAGVPAHAPVSCTLEPGQALVLRGPNGAGKTTLLRTLAGFLPPIRGEARLGSHQVGQAEFADQLFFSGHQDGIKRQLTVRENLAFWARLFGEGDITPALNALSLEPIADQLAGSCSAGQAKRLGLARLIVAKRKLWLMDEPTTALDTAAREMLRPMIATHLSGGGMAVIVTHDADFMADGSTITLARAMLGEAQADPFLSEGAY